MYEALTILADLNESDREWVFQVWIEEQFEANASVITEGSTPESVFISFERDAGGPRRAALTRAIGSESSAHSHTKDTLGARARRELLPLVLLSKSGERWYTKPRDYAGDFLTIQWIYDEQPRETSRLGPLIDRILLNLPPIRATRIDAG